MVVSGHTMALAVGWEATGIDIDPQLIEEGKQQLKADLRCVSILESGLPEGSRSRPRLWTGAT